MSDATPGQIAVYDQVLADNEHNLDVLIDAFRNAHPDSPEHIRVAGMCRFLEDAPEWTAVALAEHLVVAVRRLAGAA